MTINSNSSGLNACNCHICGSNRISYKFPSHDAEVWQCGECGFLFLNPMPVRPLADKSGAGTVFPPKLLSSWFRRFVSYGALSNKVVLDAGFGDTIALFPDTSKVKVVRAPLAQDGNQDVSSPPDGGFAACVFIDSLQKTGNPAKTLAGIRNMLRDGGALLLTLPLTEGPADKTRAAFSPGNKYFFDNCTLGNLLAKCGFSEVYAERVKINSSLSHMFVFARKCSMRARPLLSIIMPVYNEAATFPRVFALLRDKNIASVDKELIIVESTSTDGTRELVRAVESEPGVKVVYQDAPKGKGFAVRAGLACASGDFIAIQDGDLEYDINDYDQLLEPLLAYRQAFILGSRHSKGWKMRHFGGQPIVSFMMNIGQTICTALLNLFCGTSLRDPFTMYKLFRKDCLSGLSFHADRFDFDWELVIKLVRKGYVPLEIPVNYQSRSFREGKKVSMIRDPLLWGAALLRFRFCRLYSAGPSKRV